MDMPVSPNAPSRAREKVAAQKNEGPASPSQPSASRTPTMTVSQMQLNAAQAVHAQAAKAAQTSQLSQVVSTSGEATSSAKAPGKGSLTFLLGNSQQGVPGVAPQVAHPSSSAGERSRNVWKHIGTRSHQPVLQPERVPGVVLETLLAERHATPSGAIRKTQESLRHRRPSFLQENVETRTGRRQTAPANYTAEKLKEA